ncbi:MAG TPA: DUF1565 domain-containing protein [Asanoa sp.]|nr:DUF1565 domain-containing protein [Asanoa sp.]
MRVGRGLVLLCVGVLVTTGLSAVGGNAAAAAADPPIIHVVQRCDGGTDDGSPEHPYCSITQAVNAAQPGQTVDVQQGDYAQSVIVTSSGQPGKPITIKTDRGTGSAGRPTVVQADARQDAPAFVLSGVHDIVIDGFQIGLPSIHSALVVENSSDITVTNGWLLTSDRVTTQIKGDSHRVTVSGMVVEGFQDSAFAVSDGATDTLLTGNSVYQRRPWDAAQPAITVVDAPRTTITNNTIVTDCVVGVAVSGASAGFGLYNSIVRTNLLNRPGSCTPPQAPPSASATPVRVDGAAVGDSQVDYNLIDPVHGGPLYSWAGTTYPDPAAFAAATGLGTHDIAADPKLLSTGPGPSKVGWSVTGDSPAIDSALADAPGLLSRDLRGNPHADKPDVANTGGGFVDRGSAELLPEPKLTSAVSRAAGGGSFEALATVTAKYPWQMDGTGGIGLFEPQGPAAYLPILTHTGSARFTFPNVGVACVRVSFSIDGFRTWEPAYQSTQCVVLGASFTPVTPQRVLDTRSDAGVPVAPGGHLSIALPAPMSTAAAVVLNVTVTQPTAKGYLTVYPGNGSRPEVSNVNFVANQTVANLVTVPVGSGGVDLANASAGTTHVVADIAGYYANTGSGLTAGTPVRVLDTRGAIGVPGTTPIGPNGKVTVDLSSKVPAGTTAAVLNLTVTKPTTSGHFTVFPPGAAVPTASNVNFLAGQTVNNMVIAPVVGGKVAFAFGGAGTVHLLADLTGWFGPGGTDTYLPTFPTRILDTRTTGTPVGPGQTVRVTVDAGACGSTPCTRTAVVANLTVTNAKAAGYLSVYPFGQPRPVVSALNFTAGQTVANLITVGLGQDSFLVYNNAGSTVDVAVDQAGFYLSPGSDS